MVLVIRMAFWEYIPDAVWGHPSVVLFDQAMSKPSSQLAYRLSQSELFPLKDLPVRRATFAVKLKGVLCPD